MKKSKQDRLENLLWEEVASKAIKSSLGFALVAIICFFFYGKLPVFSSLIKVLTVLVVLSNIIRLRISRSILKLGVASARVRILKLSVYANSLLWGLIFVLASYESKSQGIVFMVTVTILMFFIAASLVTLAYKKSIYFFHQVSILAPMLLLFAYQCLSGENPETSIFIGLYLLVAIYQHRQYQTYRSEIDQRFRTQLDLTDSYEELKESQEQLVKHTEKLVEASKISALGEMAGGLSHEINNSAMVILGSAQQMERELRSSQSLSPKDEKRLQNIVDAVLRMKTVIEGLKHFAREGEQPEMEVYSLEAVVQRALHYSQEMIRAHDVELRLEKVPPVELFCHPFQITQVLFSLLRNADDALKAVPKTERWIRVKFNLSEGRVQISIVNSGPKISREVQGKLFQPFFSTKDLGHGTGLSLCSSKGIAQEHGGDLRFDERSTHTSFDLDLPLHLPENS